MYPKYDAIVLMDADEGKDEANLVADLLYDWEGGVRDDAQVRELSR